MDAVARKNDTGDAVRALLDDYFEAVRSLDVARITSFYAPDIVAYDAILQLQFVGVDAYRSHWQDCLAQCQAMIFAPEAPTIAASGEVAHAHCLIRCGGIGLDGEEHLGWMRATFGLGKRHGHWLIVHEHYSSPFDPMSLKVLDLGPAE